MTANAITAFFAWWNEAMADPARLTPEGFARFFTEDGQLVVNGNVRARGPDELSAHYRKIAAKCEEVAMVLPVEAAFADADHAFVHCRTHVVLDGVTAAEEAMAYAKLREGRMALLRVVSLSV